MKTSASGHHYQVRFKDLQGDKHEAIFYALDAKNAQDLAIEANEANEELRKRPHLIISILESEWELLVFFEIARMNRKNSKFKTQLDEAILEANTLHPHRWPRGLISELAKIHNTSPSSVFKRRESLCGFVRTNQGPIELESSI